MKKITILGSTGSIGKQTLDVIDQNKSEYAVSGLSCESNVDLLIAQANQYRPEAVCLSGAAHSDKLEANIPAGTTVFYGQQGLHRMAVEIPADTVLISVVGIAGLLALETCIKNDRRVALANKEALVCGGRVVRDLLDAKKAKLYPVDSELSAIFQCLNNGFETEDVHRLILTASGGPFREWEKADIEKAMPEQALKHPNWNMGAKVTIDSATLMNKGLECMETRWLFDIPPEKIDVLVHEKSIVHSMVEYTDGSVLSQMGVTDMRQPIQYALGFPKRYGAPAGFLDFTQLNLTFKKPRIENFPCLSLAFEALNDDGGSSAVVLNAANEVAVQQFLDGKFLLGGIPKIVEKAMHHFGGQKLTDTNAILAMDKEVRAYVNTL
ncbi:MAG: 1-deoxy-D-xylulose-5-phosphate reductoisomerase [Eubacteriales bacterium]